MTKATKPYLIFECSEGTLYSVTEYDTLKEALLAQKYSDDWYLVKPVGFVVQDGDEFVKEVNGNASRLPNAR